MSVNDLDLALLDDLDLLYDVAYAVHTADRLGVFGKKEREYMGHNPQTLRAFKNLLNRSIRKETFDWDEELSKLITQYQNERGEV